MPPSNTSDQTFRDAARRRDIPVRIYEPAGAARGLIMFSHGLGGTRESYRYLGEAWSAHGYRVVHVQHPGSDAGIFAGTGTPREKALRAINNLEHSHNRPLDGKSYRDPRVATAVVMSTPRPAHPQELAAISSPVLHITGTRDESPLLPGMAILRRLSHRQHRSQSAPSQSARNRAALTELKLTGNCFCGGGQNGRRQEGSPSATPPKWALRPNRWIMIGRFKTGGFSETTQRHSATGTSKEARKELD